MKILPLFLLVFFSFSSYCQEVWTLESCLDSALKNNTGIKQVLLNAEVAAVQHAQSKFDFTPDISGSAGHSYNYGRNIDPISNQFTQTSRQNSNFSLNGNLTLFRGLSRYYTLNRTKLSIENEVYNQKVTARNVKLEVLTYYLQSLLSNDLTQLSKDHLDYTLEEERRMNALIAAETKTKIDLIEVSSQKARDELAIIRAENDHTLAIQRLVRTMQISNPSEFELDTTISLFSDSSVFVNVESLPEVRQKELLLEQALIDQKISRSSYFPSLSIGAGLGSGYSNSYFLSDPLTGENYVPNFTDQLNTNLYQTIYFSLSIPIYNHHQTKTNVQLQTIGIENAKLERERLVWEMVGRVEQLQIDIENALAEMDAATTLLLYAEQDFEQTELRYANGLITYTELLNKKDRLFSAQSNLVQSKYNYYFKRKIISFYYE